jgi:hypothetical protein
MSLMLASLMKAMAVPLRFSQFLATRRHWLIQAMVRLTTKRLGMTSKPLAWAEHLTSSIRQAASVLAWRSFWPP